MNSKPTAPPTPPVAQSANPAVALDSAGNIGSDVACLKCGYNLRGLSPNGRCPECAAAVGRSIQGDFLRFCDPAWVRRLASGVNWILGCVAVSILGGMALGFSSRTLNLPPITLTVFTWFMTAAAIYGYWSYTTPDPASKEETKGLSARKLVRITQIATSVGLPVYELAESYAPEFISVLAGLAFAGLAVTGVFAIFIYTKHLARRIPNDKMARSFGQLMWILVGLTAFGIGIGIGAGISAASSPSGQLSDDGQGFLLGSTCVLWIIGFVTAILLLITIFRFRRALNEAANMADALWNSQPVGPLPPKPSNLGLV